jgi:hypothetical protein
MSAKAELFAGGPGGAHFGELISVDDGGLQGQNAEEQVPVFLHRAGGTRWGFR